LHRRDTGATAVYITHDQAEAFALADVIGVLDHGGVAQWGHPEEIYRRPATPFVARFTGLAGEFTGRVAWTDGEFLDVHVEGRPLRARVIGTAATGDTARLLVRPAATRFLAAHTGQTQNSVTGTVTDVAYRRGYDHVVTTASGTLAGVFDQHAWPRGTEVQVALDPDGCTAHTTDQPAEVSYATDLTAVSNES
jgi:ABC-type Fe3+/spermidine/putrescine transport system ATPase subunit